MRGMVVATLAGAMSHRHHRHVLPRGRHIPPAAVASHRSELKLRNVLSKKNPYLFRAVGVQDAYTEVIIEDEDSNNDDIETDEEE